MPTVSDVWRSLNELNDETPDHDHWSTEDNMRDPHAASSDLRCWREEWIHVGEVDPFQLFDDPDDSEGDAKIESIRVTLRSGGSLPAVVTIHHPHQGEHPYYLIEGKHRYNAAFRESAETIFAWVAHLDCCGGPSPDL